MNPSLEPGQNQFQSVALLYFVDELVNGEVSSDGCEQALDSPFIAVNVEKPTDHLRRANGINPLDIDLDEFGEAVLVQIENQVVDEVEAVANNNERKLVLQFGLFEEVLDLLRVVVITFAAYPLNLANLAGPRSSLNVLEMNFRIFADVNHGAEIVVEAYYNELKVLKREMKVRRTFETLETFEHLDEFDGSKDVRVLGRNLNDDLQVLPDIDFQHFLHAGHGLLGGEVTEVVHEPLYRDQHRCSKQ